MKTSARFLAVIIAVIMIVGAALTVSAFSDVEDGYKHETAINTLTQLGVIGGYEDGTFKPDANLERDEMAKLVYVLYTTFADAGKGTVKFDDVKAENWAVGYISWCSAKSIVGGYGDGTFKPDNNVTYDEALKMVCATLGYTDFDSSLWPVDVRQKALKDLKLGTGIEANGSDYLTRGQIAQLLYNALFVDMNETKLDYVFSNQYVDAAGKPVQVKVPVEVAKTLAIDIWGFDSENATVVATKNYAYNDLADKTTKDDTIIVKIGDNTKTFTLAQLGLDAYNKKTDELIGHDLMLVYKEGKLIPGASVLGTLKIAEVAYVKDGVVKVDGEEYNASALKVLAYSTGVMNTTEGFDAKIDKNNPQTPDNPSDDSFKYANADLKKPQMAIALDANGDGVVEAIAVDYFKLGEVTEVATDKVTINALVGGADFTVAPANVSADKALAKGEVFVYAMIDGVVFVDEVITPISEPVVRINSNGQTIYLEKKGAISGAAYLNGASDIALTSDDLTATAKYNFYLYGGKLVWKTDVSTGAATTTEPSYNLALLLYTKPMTEAVFNETTKKMEQSWPAVLLIDGKEVEVKLDKIDGETYNTTYEFGKTLNEGTPILAYKLVNYTVDSKTGLYTLKTTGDSNITKVEVLDPNMAITYNANTGLYKIGTKLVELNADSVIYYTYNSTDAADKYLYFGTYTAANMLKKFNAKYTSQVAYLLKGADEVYTLLATVVEGAFVEPGTGNTGVADPTPWKTDARLIKYVAETSNQMMVDGKVYYSYLFLDFATMKNGTQVVDTNATYDKATKGEVKHFYGWDANNNKYIEVKNVNGDDTIKSVEVGKITKVDAARGIIYINATINGINFTEGYKLPAGVNIFAYKSGYEYVQYDLAGLAKALQTAGDKEVRAAVGTYTENGNLGFAWIIVDYVKDADTIVKDQINNLIAGELV